MAMKGCQIAGHLPLKLPVRQAPEDEVEHTHPDHGGDPDKHQRDGDEVKIAPGQTRHERDQEERAGQEQPVGEIHRALRRHKVLAEIEQDLAGGVDHQSGDEEDAVDMARE